MMRPFHVLVVTLAANLVTGCGGGVGSPPTLVDVQAAFTQHLSNQVGAAMALDNAIAGAVSYSLNNVTVVRFVAEPIQRPGEPGWTAMIAAEGAYTIVSPVPVSTNESAVQRKSLSMNGVSPAKIQRPVPAKPMLVPSTPGKSQSIPFRRAFPIRLEWSGSAWSIPIHGQVTP